MFLRYATRTVLACLFGIAGVTASAGDVLQVGFAEVDITPDVDRERPVWIAGYGQNRRATGVHDRLFARAVVLSHGGNQ